MALRRGRGGMQDLDEHDTSAFASLLRQVARTPGYDPPLASVEVVPGELVADRFEVLREIGQGGFARVYEALDRVLSRKVALKLLRRQRTMSDHQLALFYREAQATARLNHPQIVTVHDWGEWEGTPFLVLELLDGEPLSALVARGPMPESRALTISRDVARALAYAHGEGVLHLDLKPQNVFVLRGGTVKVLDFGLAGLEWASEVPGGEARIPGGTPATMAPEQTERGPTDARADVWAVGVILHELLFGECPARLEPGAPAVPIPSRSSRAVRRILRHTLTRDPGARYPDALALLTALEDAVRTRSRRRLTAIAVAAAALVAGAFGWVAANRENLRPPAVPKHRQLTFTGDVVLSDLSPLGDRLVFINNAGREVWVRSIAGDDARRIFTGTELDWVRWSPDGEHVLVGTSPDPGGIWLVRTADGEVTTLAVPFPARGILMPDARRIALVRIDDVDRRPVLRLVALSGGADSEVALPAGFGRMSELDVSSDGRFLVVDDRAHERRGDLWVFAPGSPPEKVRSEAGRIFGARWPADGSGIFYQQNVGVDAELRWFNLRRRSAPITLLSGVALGQSLSVSRDGRRLVYQRQQISSNLALLRPDGSSEPLTEGTAELDLADVARDGRIVYSLREDQNHWIVIAGLDPAATRTRIRCPRECRTAAWSPDGTRIAFRRREPEAYRLFTMAADGSDERLVEAARPSGYKWDSLEWVTDSEIAYVSKDNGRIRVVDLESGSDRLFIDDPGWTGSMWGPLISPDGRRAAFVNFGARRGICVSDASGTNPKLLVPGCEGCPFSWTNDSSRLMVARSDTGTDLGGRFRLEELEIIDVRDGAVLSRRALPAGLRAHSVRTIPGSEDLLVKQYEERTDAWLIDGLELAR